MSRYAPDPIVERARQAPGGAALRVGAKRWSNARLLEVVDGLARALVDTGVAAGGSVACLLDDDAPAVALVHAVRRIGAILVPLNRRAAPGELGYQLTQPNVEVLISDGANATNALAAAAELPVHLVDHLLAAEPGASEAHLRDDVALDEAATILFTSGTTGRPKGAVLTHGNHAASADAWAAVLRPRTQDRWLACLPLFHVAGLAMVMRAARWNVELEIQGRFDAQAVSDSLQDGVTHLSLVTTQLARLLEVRLSRAVPTSLRAILLGGGPIPVALLAQARALGYPVMTTYGMTETGSGVAVGGADGETLADPSALRPLPGAQIGLSLEGEIRVRGAMVFPGYLDALDGEGAGDDDWFDTGDLGSVDPGGLLRVRDRGADLIISGGENIYPAEIEAVLRRHPRVEDVVVTGRGDSRWGQVPIAFVVPSPGTRLDDDELAAFCRERLAGFKVPTRFHRVDALPRDEMGKVRMVELLGLAAELER